MCVSSLHQEALIAEFKLKRRTLALLADVDGNLNMLREESAATASRCNPKVFTINTR